MPTNLNARRRSSGGTLHAGTHFYVVTGMVGGNESLPSNEVSAVTAENGAVVLTWTAMPGATDYKVYRGGTEGGENVVIDTGRTSTTFTDSDLGAGAAVPHPPTVGAVFAQSQPTAALAWNATAADGAERARGPDVDRRRQRRRHPERRHVRHPLPGLAQRHGAPDAHDDAVAVQEHVEQLGGGTTTTAGTAIVTPRAPGASDPAVNQVQILHGDRDRRQRTSCRSTSTAFRSRPTPIAYNASAEQLRQTIQNAIAAVESSDPFVQAFLVDKLDVWVSRYPSAYLNQDVYVLQFQGELRKEQFGPGLDTVTSSHELAHGRHRIDDDSDGRHRLLRLRSRSTSARARGSEVFNVEGTTQGSNGFAGVVASRDERRAERRRRPRLPVVERRISTASNAYWNELRLPHRQPRRLPRRAEHRPRRRPAPPVHERRGVDARRQLRDHRLVRRHAHDRHGRTRIRRRHLRHARRAAGDLVQRTTDSSGNLFDGVELLDGLGQRHRLHRRDASRTARQRTTTDPQHRPRQRQRHRQPRGRTAATGSSCSRPRAARRRATPVSHSLPTGATDNDTVDAHAVDAAARDHRRLRQRLDQRRPGQRHHPRRPRDRAVHDRSGLPATRCSRSSASAVAAT